MRLEDARPGQDVAYVHHDGRREHGTVTSIGLTGLIFVRFADDHPSANGKACHPDNLEDCSG